MTYDLPIKWFCRMCWQRGTIGATIRPIDERFPIPSKEELLVIVSYRHAMTSIRCKTPDLRLHYDTKERTTN